MTAVAHDGADVGTDADDDGGVLVQVERVSTARAQIAEGIRQLRLATDGDDVARARAYTSVLRDLVGAGGARTGDGPDAGWAAVLRIERQAAMRRLSAEGRDANELGRLTWMTRVRVAQIIGGGRSGTERLATGRPTGRPAGATGTVAGTDE